MSDRFTQIYLYLIIFGNLFFGFLWLVFWIFAGSRRSSVPTKLLWRDITWLISGIVGWYVFSRHLLNNTGVFVVTFILIVVSSFLVELVYRLAATLGQGAPHNKSLDASRGSVFRMKLL